MAIRMKTQVDIKMTGDVRSHARTDVRVRDVSATIDEPEARGGTNQGLTPTETQIAALVGCTNVITQRLAHRDGVKIGEMAIEADAKFDRRGAALEEEVALPFPRVRLEITLSTDATDEQLAQIRDDLGRYCPIAKLMRAAGTEIEEHWTARPL